MSQWTHVAGIIRFDALRILGMPAQVNQNPSEFMGNTFEYEDDAETWNACTVPRGSEGSLQYVVWVNPHPTALSAYTVTVFGDLRDYDDEAEIISYFRGVVEGRLVRQATFEVAVEYQPPRVFHYVEDHGFVELTDLQNETQAAE